MRYDQALASIAAKQYGVISRAQVLGAGVPEKALKRRVAAGGLRGRHRGVYVVTGTPQTFRGELLAACLAAGDHAVASHRAAGALWGLQGVGERLELSVLRPGDPRVKGARIHRVSHLDRLDLTCRDAIPVTRPARTLVDLAEVVSPDALELAVDDALGRGLVSCPLVQARLRALGGRGRKGTAALRAVLDARPEGHYRVQSPFEQRLLRLLADHGIEGAVPQYEVVLPSGRRVRLDVAFPPVRLALEADSYAHHGSRSAWARDHTRNAELVAAGWRVLPVTWQDLTRRPAAVVALVSVALAA